ncbi:phosphoenolpyruvate synthase [Paraflavisolibacter sp. H34]|uniref:phosphoenolpyruvate synthase n=1 Tax=Huijunlia imazamoxiresistens TaxID=3127457 RepID=UPI00301A22B0
MASYVLHFPQIDRTKILEVGGKGAHLGELSRIEGVRVPEGFCVTTEAYKKVTGQNLELKDLLEELKHLQPGEREKIGALSARIRKEIANTPIPREIEVAIAGAHELLGADEAYAVRSSATAEDLPGASFAGQQDTYLNVTGKKEILQHISQCWASLFTDRAVIYRQQNGFDHSQIALSVIIQRMVFPKTSGILFTADPVTGNRKIISIDAGFGLGEALVSGRVNADHFKVRNGQVVEKKIAAKKLAIYAVKEGGTREQALPPEGQQLPALTDEQAVELEQLGRTIEAHFGGPQDIEWCLAGDNYFILQSRPITTLFPVPEVPDQQNHVYLSVGHQQMMTDAIKPLGISFFQKITLRPMATAGGRLFVDITQQLASPAGRKTILELMAQHEPLMKDALLTLTEREDFIPSLPDAPDELAHLKIHKGPEASAAPGYDPSPVEALISSSRESIAALRRQIGSKSGPELFDFIQEDVGELKKLLFDPNSLGLIMAAIHASTWINEKIEEWLGEAHVADTLSQSVPHNITSQMGLDLLQVADVLRPYGAVIRFLEQVKDENFLEELDRLEGGKSAREAIQAYLDQYGMRGVGEIDISRTRWSEKPSTLVPLILSNIKNFEPGAGQRKFEQGRQEALAKEQELLHRLRQLPDGQQKAAEAQQKIRLIREFIGYREYPKYALMNRYFEYKKALWKEAERLVQAGVLQEKEELFYLSFEELHEAVRTGTLEPQIIRQRKDDYKLFEKLTPPRVLTSDGEIITGAYKRENLPAAALPGLPVSAGTIEGRARVLLHMEDAHLEAGDILVTAFTDPSWTPLFVSIKGLVTEVGGLMTHGAVIAREYGLPAVVGVEGATKLIKDGQRIRVNGTEGYVEIL